MNRDDFFDQTPQLERIRQWARARYVAPWALFGAVPARVAASTGPEVQLPGVSRRSRIPESHGRVRVRERWRQGHLRQGCPPGLAYRHPRGRYRVR